MFCLMFSSIRADPTAMASTDNESVAESRTSTAMSRVRRNPLGTKDRRPVSRASSMAASVLTIGIDNYAAKTQVLGLWL